MSTVNCENCPLREICKSLKVEASAPWVKDVRDVIQAELDSYCPLVDIARRKIKEEAEDIARSYEEYLYGRMRFEKAGVR